MMFQQLSLVLAVGALGWYALGQQPAPSVAKDASPTYMLAPSAKVLGLPLRNAADVHLGDIGDLLVDPRTGEIRYAVLDVGGFLGVGEDHRVVPWSFVQVAASAKDSDKLQARTTLTEAQVKAAPLCKKDEAFTSELDRRTEAAFGKDGAWTYSGKGEASFVRLRDMDGVLISDRAGKEVGTVDDLVLAPQNRCIAYAVVETSKEAGAKLVGLPCSQLEFAYDQERKLTARTPVEIARFSAAPVYDRADWKRMSSTAWITELSQYYGCDPFWKSSRFVSPRVASAQG